MNTTRWRPPQTQPTVVLQHASSSHHSVVSGLRNLHRVFRAHCRRNQGQHDLSMRLSIQTKLMSEQRPSNRGGSALSWGKSHEVKVVLSIFRIDS
eukprot:3663683-Amphidinium_carterae.1